MMEKSISLSLSLSLSFSLALYIYVFLADDLRKCRELVYCDALSLFPTTCVCMKDRHQLLKHSSRVFCQPVLGHLAANATRGEPRVNTTQLAPGPACIRCRESSFLLEEIPVTPTMIFLCLCRPVAGASSSFPSFFGQVSNLYARDPRN